jgi:hypothetical protein
MHKRIQIAERLAPFSHRPGIVVILPGLNIQAEIFPCLIRLYSIHEAYPIMIKEYFLDFGEPIAQFTVFHHLEKGWIKVEGKMSKGWFRYKLMSSPTTGGVQLVVECSPEGGFTIQHETHRVVLNRNDIFNMIGDAEEFHLFEPPHFERLSLGNHKKQDWDLVNRRLDLKEIFPIWLRLGQMAPPVSKSSSSLGTLSLLQKCEDNLLSEGGERVEQPWLNLYRAAFHGIMVPRIEDADYQGFIPSASLIPEGISPTVLLTEGARLIRQQFIDDRRHAGGALMILPHLLSSFTCGRFIDVPLGEWGVLSMEWSKRKIRRLVIKAKQQQELPLNFGSQVRSFRLQSSLDKRGEPRQCPASVIVMPERDYLFDNFQ